MSPVADPCSLALTLGRILLEHKAEGMVLLDVRGLASYTDFMLILSGRSTRQLMALAEHLLRQTRELKIKPFSQEGRTQGRWVLLDYGSVVVHLFLDEVREYYDLESLWSEAGRYSWRADDPDPDIQKEEAR